MRVDRAALSLAAACAAVVVVVVGCTGGPATPDAGVDDSACPNDLPASCPSPAPSYQNDVGPIVANTCAQCHAPGKLVAEKPLDTYDGLFQRRSAALNQVFACTMPPPDAGVVLPLDDRATLLGWFVCGSPQN